MSDNGSKTVPEAIVGQLVSRSAYDEALNAIVAGDKRLEAAISRADAAEQMVAELRATLTTGRDIVIETSTGSRHTKWVEQAYDAIEASAPIAGRWCLASERDEALRLLATRVEAKRLDEAQEEIAALREACTLALGIMEQKNRVTVLTTAKFVDVKFDQEDIAVLRAALEKKT